MPSKISLPKIGKMKYSFAPLLKNKVVLYTFLAMTLIQIVFFANNGNMAAIITMGLVGFITSFFSKNMIVILCIALTVSTLLTFGIKMNAREGLENNDEQIEEDKPKDKKSDKKEEKPAKKETDSEDKSEEKSEKTKDEIMEEELKKELPEYQEVQDEIMKGVKDMEPLLEKAEAFINKYADYKPTEASKKK